ncbi:MAG: hypothetical protein M1829_001374 [Trizodia sp. TS-e1964]|nr:MAG: hypothetical protein M1829_001374 [Trizodia sp. TS-e1964]
MSHFLRGKQAGVQTDLSAGLFPDIFAIDDVARYGVNSRISTISYDPVQSLLAVGTSEWSGGSGQLYIFGQKRVCVTFSLPRKATVTTIQFCGEKLVSVDSKNEFSVFCLESKKLLASYTPPGFVTSLLTDPSMDWAFLGLQNGDVLTYDLDREKLAPFRIPNLWRERSPKARLLPVVSLALHPRDIGTLLIAYSEGAALFSFKQNKPTKFFRYEVPRGAPGGDSDPSSARVERQPRICQAVWHPTGTFIMTAHEDSSLVFWDPKDGRIVMARTLQDVNVNKPGASAGSFGSNPGTFSLKEPIFRVSWCAKENPDDTGILLAGGASTTLLTKGLTFMELGPTPTYATSSWQILSDHFASPKKQHILPTPPNAEVVDFCLIPRASPYFAGAQDPIAVIALLSSGEIATLSFPTGYAIPPINQLHVSLSFVHPFVNTLSVAPVERTRWLGMSEKRDSGPTILNGGAEASHMLRRCACRNIIQTAHADGTVKLWDIGHNDEIENGNGLQVDVARALARFEGVEITHTSLAGATGELAVGLRSGELVIFRWGKNKNFGREGAASNIDQVRSHSMTDIQDRSDPGLREGLLPLSLLTSKHGPVSSLKLSDIGFAAVGFEGGGIAIVDLRGPAVIYEASLSDFTKQNKRGSFRKSGTHTSSKPEWPSVIEFGVMSLDGEEYSSILVFVGTNLGHLATFKLLPEGGGYTVKYAGSCSLDDPIIAISPLNAESGAPAYASQSAVAGLRSGIKVPGVIIATTGTGTRIFKPSAAKGAHKTWDQHFCLSAAVVEYEEQSHALACIFSDGHIRAYSLPGLKELASLKIPHINPKRLAEATLTTSGAIVGWGSPSEIAVLHLFGSGTTLPASKDRLFNPEIPPPPRPTISNLQWMSGTQYVSPGDMDVLIGGPDRPVSRRMLEQSRADQRALGAGARPGLATQGSSGAAGQEEGYWAYMQRQVNERTQKLSLMGDSMDKVAEGSSNWANDVSKFVNQQKRKAVLGGEFEHDSLL